MPWLQQALSLSLRTLSERLAVEDEDYISRSRISLPQSVWLCRASKTQLNGYFLSLLLNTPKKFMQMSVSKPESSEDMRISSVKSCVPWVIERYWFVSRLVDSPIILLKSLLNLFLLLYRWILSRIWSLKRFSDIDWTRSGSAYLRLSSSKRIVIRSHFVKPIHLIRWDRQHSNFVNIWRSLAVHKEFLSV